MQQRQLRLGDVLDDYCPRERRLSNHVIVAMVGDEVKRTRCTTCDDEHPYRQGKVPPRRSKKDAPPALFRRVLEGMPEGTEPPANDALPAPLPPPQVTPTPVKEDPAPAAPPRPQHSPEVADEGPAHRHQLIRATLPRTEGPPTRPAPDFTMHGVRNGERRRFGRSKARAGNTGFQRPPGGPQGGKGGGGQGRRAHHGGHPNARPAGDRSRGRGPRRPR